MAVAGVARVGHQDLVTCINIERCRGQQPSGCSRGYRYAGRSDSRAELRLIVGGDGLAQRRQAERRSVCRQSVADRAHAGLDHGRRRGEVGFADLHVDDVPPGGFERMRAR
jgi:hypothetical protein